MKPYFFFLLTVTTIFSFYPINVPPIKGFTTIAECAQENISIKLLLDDGLTSEFVACFPLGIVVNEGGIITCKGKILQDTETYGQDQHHLMKGNIPDEKDFFDGKLAIISSPGQENWYHWLLEVLPRLKILVESGYEFDKIYIDNLKYKWQKESLKIVCDALHIPDDKLLLFQDNVLIQAKTLLVPSVPFIPSKDRTLLPAWLKKFIREIFLKTDLKFETPKKIYISRLKAKVRRIANEDKLVQFLEKQGFVTLYLEDLSIFEQASIFNNAEIIIGPHGSGFTNLIFCKSGTRVVEIDHALEGEEQRSYFKYFSAFMGCHYTPFYTDLVTEDNLEKDLYVDVSTFEILLSKILQ